MQDTNQMSIQQYLDKMKDVQSCLLNYIDDESNAEENFESLIQLLNDLEILINKHELMSFFHLITEIFNNHHRFSNFFEKIFRIIRYIKNDISKLLSNYDIFSIFNSSNRLLLFLIEEKIISINQAISKKMIKQGWIIIKKNKQNYFFPELKLYIDKKLDENKLPENFVLNRKNGENEKYICQLIQNDSIEDFVSYINKNNISLNKYTIKPSKYETNLFLVKKRSPLINYAAFYGSIQIFQYLLLNQVELRPSLWIYAIHGSNPNIIHIIEENNIKPKSYIDCLKEAIKCHHNDIAHYIINCYINDEQQIKNCIHQSLQYYNFEFIQLDFFNPKNDFYDFCQFDYFYFANYFLNTSIININEKITINREDELEFIGGERIGKESSYSIHNYLFLLHFNIILKLRFIYHHF